MSCKSCGGGQALDTCAFCGHGFCGNHRGTLDGSVACTGCLKGEQERRLAAQAKRRAREEQRQQEQSARRAADAIVPPGGETPSGRIEPLPEPPGWAPLGYALLAAVGAGGYAWWLVARQVEPQQLPAWSSYAAGVAVGLLVGFGVWALAKTRLTGVRAA